jgi:hypothetical protein
VTAVDTYFSFKPSSGRSIVVTQGKSMKSRPVNLLAFDDDDDGNADVASRRMLLG